MSRPATCSRDHRGPAARWAGEEQISIGLAFNRTGTQECPLPIGDSVISPAPTVSAVTSVATLAAQSEAIIPICVMQVCSAI